MILPNDFHSGNFLSLIIGNEDGGSMPAIVLRKFLGENESMRHGVAGPGKNRSRFVRIPAAVDNVEIKPASHRTSLGGLFQRDRHEITERIDFVREAASWIVETREDIANRILRIELTRFGKPKNF